MTKTILCAVDFSDSSVQALKWAIGMARELGAHLTILNTYRFVQSVNDQEAIILKKKMEDEARGGFTKIENDLLKDQGISFEFKLEIGFVRDRVEHYARRHELLFCVIGKSLSVINKEGISELIDRLTVPLVIIP